MSDKVRFKVVKPCFVGGSLRQVGEIVEAPAAFAGSALERVEPAPAKAKPPAGQSG